MFGMEKGKKKKQEASPQANHTTFDLETEILHNASRRSELKTHLQKQIESLRERLREGENTQNFEHYTTLLRGYVACMKVVDRIAAKK